MTAAVAAQVLAHLLETRAIQESGRRDETHDAVKVFLGLSGRLVPT
jgi:hypothetical protein